MREEVDETNIKIATIYCGVSAQLVISMTVIVMGPCIV